MSTENKRQKTEEEGETRNGAMKDTGAATKEMLFVFTTGDDYQFWWMKAPLECKSAVAFVRILEEIKSRRPEESGWLEEVRFFNFVIGLIEGNANVDPCCEASWVKECKELFTKEESSKWTMAESWSVYEMEISHNERSKVVYAHLS